jgi:hypothetical protein
VEEGGGEGKIKGYEEAGRGGRTRRARRPMEVEGSRQQQCGSRSTGSTGRQTGQPEASSW